MNSTPKRPRRFLAALAGVILVVLAVAGCNRGGNSTVPPAPSASAAPATTALDSSSGSGLLDDTSSPVASDSAAISPSASATPAAPATPDAVASELDQIQRLIDDINSSLSSSDGGE